MVRDEYAMQGLTKRELSSKTGKRKLTSRKDKGELFQPLRAKCLPADVRLHVDVHSWDLDDQIWIAEAVEVFGDEVISLDGCEGYGR